MRFIENEQRAALEVAEPITEWCGINLIDQETVRHEEARVRAPWVYAEAAVLADLLHVILVEDFKCQTEASLQFVLPLEQHRRRTTDDDLSSLLSQKQFPRDESRL